MRSHRYLLALGFSLLAAQAAVAAPVLKSEVDVSGKIVTAGDMFDGAGSLADRPLFRAPAPGTSGLVGVDDIRVAANRAGIDAFDSRGATDIRVSRLGVTVDQALLNKLLSDALTGRGALTEGMTATAVFDTPPAGIEAAAVADPAKLTDFHYAPDSGLFNARFDIAGQDTPLDLSGRIDLTILAPQLTATLAAGAILSSGDIAMRPVAAKLVDNGNVASLEQLIGKQLQRQSRAGMVLKVSDVAEPILVERSQLVTVYLHAGTMTLTVKGTALNAASLGQPVAVLNASSKKVIHGVARADGAVEITATPLSVAGL